MAVPLCYTLYSTRMGSYCLIAFLIFTGISIITQAHDEIVEDLFNIIFKLKGKTANAPRKLQKIPAFNAVLSKDFTPLVNRVIKFDTVQTNIGGHYSPNTGVFTAPKGGLYTFSATIRSSGARHLHCELHVNDKMYERAYGYSKTTGTINAVLQLKKGDKVCIKKDNHGSELMYGRYWSMFSGHMIA